MPSPTIPVPRSTIHPPQSEAPTQILEPGKARRQHGPAVPIGWQYFWGALIPLVAVALSVRRFSKQDMGNGIGLLITAAVSFLIWSAILAVATAEAGWKVDRAQEIARIVWHDPCGGDVTIRWASIDAAATTDADEGRPGDDDAGCVTTFDTKGPGGTGDRWTWDFVCTYVIHEYGHFAGFMDWSNTDDPNHSSNPQSVMFFAPSTDPRCRGRGLPYLRAHDNG